jgi:hypothetical protein
VLKTMADIHQISEQVIDYAERAADVADAAKGKGRSNAVGTRWLVLPAAGAALYALIRSDFVSRSAKAVAGEAKTRASELPDDLMKTVRQTTSQKPARRTTSRSRSTSSSKRRPSSKRTAATR